MARKPRRTPVSADQAKEIQRQEFIVNWATAHGSPRLLEQIVQGYSGWPLFLHERLLVTYPYAELKKEAIDYEISRNPTEAELAMARSIAAQAVSMSLFGGMKEAFHNIKIRQYYVLSGYSDQGDEAYRMKKCIVMTGFRPGPKEYFKPYTIVLPATQDELNELIEADANEERNIA